jgi:2'-hydroxyisoflavone reductase
MRLLILGGTIFLGRAIAEEALRRQHTLTLFTRGKHGQNLFPDVEKLIGDRDGNLSALANRTFDAVIDTCGYVPRIVRLSAEFLRERAMHYTFVSSISVYDTAACFGDAKPTITEDTSLAKLADEKTETITGETYGGLKALCETAAEDAMPNRVLNVRAGLIVGRYDQSGRYAYWANRLARGGETLAAPEDSPVQFIDVRDLAEWILNAVEKNVTGAFNATGDSVTTKTFLHESAKSVSQPSTFTHVSDKFLLDEHVAPYTGLPLWLPKEYDAMSRIDCVKAKQNGLTTRSLGDTMLDTSRWFFAEPTERQGKLLGQSLSAERETELLRLWHETTHV